jgi:Protein of unknown function (DUF2652)/Polyketide cyclase / dehydrase and lipid transport
MAEKGYFVIADITGYTAFLTGSELDHAQDILKSLFDSILDAVQPPLIISNFQGDAVLTYAKDGTFHEGQILLETVENIYISFAHKRELMQINTTCTCKACSNIPLLDLKLFVHYGEYIIQQMRDRAELSGPDVIIAHRMMKNRVKEETGYFAYTLFSEAAVNSLGLQDFTCEMKAHSETYEHIGEVKMYAYCLKTMWEQRREQRRLVIDPAKPWFKVEADIPAPPAMVWGYLHSTEMRRQGFNVKGVSLSQGQNGRTGTGSVYHCEHGGSSTTDFAILDWQPFDYFTERVSGMPMKMAGSYTMRLVATEQGTHITIVGEFPSLPSGIMNLPARLMATMMSGAVAKGYANLLELVREAVAKESQGPSRER